MAFGADARVFLQGQLTCDLNALSPTKPQQSRLSAYCDRKGRVEVSLRIWEHQGVFFLWTPSTQLPTLQQLLKKYALFSKVQFQPCPQALSLLLSGDHAAAFLSAEFSQVPVAENEIFIVEDCLAVLRLEGEAPRYLLVGLAPLCVSIQERLHKIPLQFQSADSAVFRLQNIQALVATVYPETRAKFLPQMLGYDKLQAIGLQKGCYLGQEIIARVHYLGQVKKQLQVYSCGLEAHRGLKIGDTIELETVEKGHCQGVIVELALVDAVAWMLVVV